MRRLIISACSLCAVGFCIEANASERHFTFTNESAVLAPGEKELEFWTTYKRGREDYYTRLENRLEVEFGVTDRLMTAFYLNTRSTTTPNGTGGLNTEAKVQGASMELKYKLSDPVADAVGAALYGEVGLGSDEAEFEAKIIIDKRVDNVLLAFNAVYEAEAEFELDETEYEHVVETDWAAAYFLKPRLSLGLEARTHHVFSEYEDTRGALYVGPVLAFQSESFWIALTTQWQVTELGGATNDRSVELNEHERFNGRLLLGTHF